MKLIYDREVGWGNTLIQVSDFLFTALTQRKVPHLPEPIECIQRIDVSTDPEEETYKGNIYINNATFQHVHPLMCDFVVPTPKVRELVEKNAHGCTTGLHIRRGNYGPDSKVLDDGTPHQEAAWFCDDTTLQKFIKIIEDASEPVFVATDSMDLRRHLLEKYPDKVRMSDIKGVVHSRRCDDADNTEMYLDWFLLSQCKKVYITAGDQNLKGFSTFGYTAAVYGHAQVDFVSS
jgi:hypothetical protein